VYPTIQPISTIKIISFIHSHHENVNQKYRRNSEYISNMIGHGSTIQYHATPSKLRQRRGRLHKNLPCCRNLPFRSRVICLFFSVFLVLDAMHDLDVNKNQTAITTSGKLPPNIQREKVFHWSLQVKPYINLIFSYKFNLIS
jgi:hypothetical protein